MVERSAGVALGDRPLLIGGAGGGIAGAAVMAVVMNVTDKERAGMVSGTIISLAALTEALGVAHPAVTQHLGKLRLAGLFTMRREGRSLHRYRRTRALAGHRGAEGRRAPPVRHPATPQWTRSDRRLSGGGPFQRNRRAAP
jgi:DNA-binding transcriptional ArsR family regulator